MTCYMLLGWYTSNVSNGPVIVSCSLFTCGKGAGESCLSYIGVGDTEGIGLRRLWSVIEDGRTGDTQMCKLLLFDSLLS